MSSKKYKVASFSDVSTDGDQIIVEISGREIAIFNIEGEFHAIANYCTHQAGPLCEDAEPTGYVDLDENDIPTWEGEGRTVTCPWHGWKFDIPTGENVKDEKYKVPTYDVEVENEDVYVII
jgi:nitrite reductase/ring-hydroxylating ferredoxin subunit